MISSPLPGGLSSSWCMVGMPPVRTVPADSHRAPALWPTRLWWLPKPLVPVSLGLGWRPPGLTETPVRVTSQMGIPLGRLLSPGPGDANVGASGTSAISSPGDIANVGASGTTAIALTLVVPEEPASVFIHKVSNWVVLGSSYGGFPGAGFCPLYSHCSLRVFLPDVPG